MRKFLSVLCATALLVACEQTAETKSGIQVKYVKKANGEQLIDGQVVLLNLKYTAEDDRVILESKPGEPLPLGYQAEAPNGNLFQEVLTLLSIGDSVYFEVPAKNLWEVTFRRPLPDTIGAESNIKFYIGAEQQMTREDYQAYQIEAEEKKTAAVQEEQLAEIDTYLSTNNISATKTESGLRYVVTSAGGGDRPQSGDEVKVHYTGTLLDGTKFDSSVDRGQPFTFPLGQGRVIKGWDEGIALLGVGDKATLYIPSSLGYGSRGSGPVIPPFAILVFEVELLGIN
ncbi:MAG: FKBP-type peptidyl-prolyl cis-trans isomerase [Cyclobacteriaceae bacterium]|nr:FKBP-type peptidyl-prolyl cis-trans isomerase [Cyclobacteriaceae bacterium HetDA_MAG_MS6]